MKTKLAVLFVVTLVAAGCHSTVNSVENAQKTGQPNMIPDQRVVTDMSLNRKVSVFGVNTAMTPGGVLRVQAQVVNRTKSLQRFTYRFDWFDANGMQINNVSSATIADQIDGGETKFISGVAPTPACKDFKLQMIKID
jgi:uncharacterized protein YcfL